MRNCATCRGTGVVTSYWPVVDGKSTHTPNGVQVACTCSLPRVNLVCDKCGWSLLSRDRDYLSDATDDTKRAATRHVLILAEKLQWQVGRHGIDVDLCPPCARES